MMPEPILFKRADVLSVERALYFQELLYRTIKIGTELEFAMPKGVQREQFQPKIETQMQPSRDMNHLGPLGVFDVIKEHCGIEIQIIGRHPQWNALIEQYNGIMQRLLCEDIRIRSTCGLHFHILTVGLSESIPEIILANLWNMTRRHAAGLKFLTSAGTARNALCRRRQNNSHREFMRQSPLQQSMEDIQQNLKASLDVPEHQNFFNLEHIRFDAQGGIGTFHVEFRFPDAEASVFSIVAKTFLFHSMVLKAVEVSKFGLLHVGKLNEWNETKRLLDLLSNNRGDLACSDTSRLTDHDIDLCRENAKDLLKFLKSIFILSDNPAESVLHALAETPISFRRIREQSWQQIDRDLAALIRQPELADELDITLFKIIELGLIEEAKSADEWFRLAATRANISKQLIQQRLERYAYRKPQWDTTSGRMVFLK